MRAMRQLCLIHQLLESRMRRQGEAISKVRECREARQDMKVGLFHGQAVGTGEGLEWQCVCFNVTDKSLGKMSRARQAQVLDEYDTVARIGVSTQPCHESVYTCK